MVDPLREPPEYIGKEHIFLPSDVPLVSCTLARSLDFPSGCMRSTAMMRSLSANGFLDLRERRGRKCKPGQVIAQAVEEFWNAQRSSRWFQNHPVLSHPVARHSMELFTCAMCSQDTVLAQCIPLLFHGDDADSHRRRSFYVATVSSPLCSFEHSLDSRCLLCCLENSRALPETYDAIDHWMVYGFMELQAGFFFSVDVWGEQFPRGKHGRVMGSYVGILCGIKGDEKFIQRALKVNAAPNSEGVCLYCDASKSGENVYTSFGPKAPHRSTMVSNDEFFRRGCRPNAWLGLPGMDVQRLFLDWLHVVDRALLPEAAASVPRWIFVQVCLLGFRFGVMAASGLGGAHCNGCGLAC